jgi:hypothetical protein
VAVSVGRGVNVLVGVKVIVGVGVKVGPKSCPGPQADSAKLATTQTKRKAVLRIGSLQEFSESAVLNPKVYSCNK